MGDYSDFFATKLLKMRLYHYQLKKQDVFARSNGNQSSLMKWVKAL